MHSFNYDFHLDDEALTHIIRNPKNGHLDPKTRPTTTNYLVPNLPRRWNSPSHVFWWFLILHEAFNGFFKGWDYKNFSFLPIKWEYIKQMCDLLLPLSKAKDIICQSNHPKIHQLIPIYVVVIQGLNSVSHLCNFTQHSFNTTFLMRLF